MSTASPGLSSLLPAGGSLPAGEPHQVATGDSGQLHAIVAGAGRPLVLTHGALLSLEAWALLWQPLLAAGRQLIAYDLRGHGRSTLGWSGFGVHAYAQDLAAVLDHFDVRQGVVVVHSTGGIGALALAMAAWSSADGRAGQAGQDQQGRQGVAASRPCPDPAGTATAGPSPRAREIVAPIPLAGEHR